MKLCVFIFAFVNLFGSLTCVTSEDIAACKEKEFGVTICTSINFYYRECIVPGVDLIHAIKLNRSLTKELCEFKTTFGIRANAIWVTSGCSGEFYICYDGEPMTTLQPPITVTSVTSKTDPPSTTEGVHIKPETSTAGSSDVLIYVIVASCVVLLVGVGLIVGCVVKRRQQNDKSRQLAEKRQIRIELKEHRENMEENGVTMVPVANKSLSVESLNCIESNNSNRNSCEYEKEGSVCSSRSSASTYLSSRTTGHLMRTRPGLHRMSSRLQFDKYGKLKRGVSTPDISSLGRMYCDTNISSKHQLASSLKRHNRSSLIRCSQNSLESVREICSKYQVFGIPLENKLQQQARRPSKVNTVSFCDSAFRSDKPNISKNVIDFRKFKTMETKSHIPDRLYRSMRSLPRESRQITKAIVHSRSPSLKDLSVTTVTKSAPDDDHTLGKDSNVDNLQNSHPCSQGSSELDNLSTSVEKPDTLPPKETQESVLSKQFHYYDPSSLIRTPTETNRTPTETNVFEKHADSFQSDVTVKKPDIVYETVHRETKAKPKLLPKPTVKPNAAIYATVNKSYFKAVSKADRRDIAQGDAMYGQSLEDDETDAVSMSSERENQYARLGKFRSTPVFSIPVPLIRIPGVSTAATKI